jgi:hypothetical protein
MKKVKIKYQELLDLIRDTFEETALFSSMIAGHDWMYPVFMKPVLVESASGNKLKKFELSQKVLGAGIKIGYITSAIADVVIDDEKDAFMLTSLNEYNLLNYFEGVNAEILKHFMDFIDHHTTEIIVSIANGIKVDPENYLIKYRNEHPTNYLLLYFGYLKVRILKADKEKVCAHILSNNSDKKYQFIFSK